MRVLLALALASLAVQDSNDELLRRLSEGRIEEREEAARELVRRGPGAVPALDAAAKSRDVDLALRAKLCLDKISFAERLTPGLRAIDGLAERVRRSPREWDAILAEALPSPQRMKAYQRVGPEDLTLLARETLRASIDSQSLLRALQAVGRYRLAGALDAVAEKAAHTDPLVRRWSAHARVLLAGDRGLDAAEPLLTDADASTRDGAISALAELKIPGTGARLARVAADRGVSTDLSTAFWMLRAKEGIPFLEKMCRLPGFDDHMPRSSAAMHLSFYAGPDQIPLFRDLLKFLKDDPNTAYNALNHLGTWGDRESIPAIEKAIAGSRLWGNCPGAAAKVLFLTGATDSQASFLKLAREGEGRDVALRALGQMGDPRAIPGVREFLNPPNMTAVVALAELGDRESLPSIRLLLSNRDRNLRGAACTALAILDDRESIAAVSKLGPEADTARRIWPALGQERRDSGAVAPGADQHTWSGTEYGPQLIYGSHSTHGYPRYISVRAVATARSGVDVDSLRQIAESEGERALYASAALVRLGRREGLAHLLKEDHFIVALNRLRRPETWAWLDGKPSTVNAYAPYRVLHERLAAEAGLRLEGPPPASDAHKAWTDVYNRLGKWGRPPSIVEAFELIEDSRWSVVFEADRIRIVPLDQAKSVWTLWEAGSEK